jgi:hypothetical protein
MRQPPPHYTQFAPAETWREAGARSPAEFERWRNAGCGMACLQMILAATGRPVPGLVELGLACTEHGGYVITEDRFEGLMYAGFVRYVAAAWEIPSALAAPLPLAALVAAVHAGAFVMASVHPTIRDAPTPPPTRGGHLVLVFATDGERVCLNDPSGLRPEAEHAVWLPLAQFAAFYAERGILIWA